MDLLFCAKYPFTKEARECVLSSGAKLDYSVIEKGEERVKSALVKGKILKFYPTKGTSIGATLEKTLRMEIASYAAARMIILSMRSRFLMNRYAVAEAKRASSYLKNDRDENVKRVGEEVGVHIKNGGIPVAEYLVFAPKAVEYKLSNKGLKNGTVFLRRSEGIRVIEEGIRKRIERLLGKRVPIPKEIEKASERIRAALPKKRFAERKVGEKNFPPCIAKLIEDLRMSESLPHTARWALGVYLAKVGMETDSIIELFSSAPDFNLGTTRYQVEYIKKRNYSMPSCSTMESYGLCVSNCRCSNPLSYKAKKAETAKKVET